MSEIMETHPDFRAKEEELKEVFHIEKERI